LNHISFHRQINTLSGGEVTRLSLAKAFLTGADFLLLDEPTNHLDINSIKTIESILTSYQGALIVVSHDDRFLENIKITRKIYAPFS
jgi:ATP-binding cassette subfamily F protein 3